MTYHLEYTIGNLEKKTPSLEEEVSYNGGVT